MRKMLRLQRPSAWVWLLLAAAIFMRAVMPTGYMAQAKGDEIVVGICNSDATWRIPLPAKHDKAKDHKNQAPCAFAGFAQAAITTPPSPQFVAPDPVVEIRTPHPVRPFSTAPPRLLPPARGPPLPV
ncbi:DUF2946 family protein [Croceicoccus bisphenolivorans]|uniref:DUF2946 family protein n=1 Tax=Croceicoccus bisphenolivorans TaxID=1783232 RepID=UPI0008337372|nr:DUF2946 family protein [Croceicoccus bisphenolivorans]